MVATTNCQTGSFSSTEATSVLGVGIRKIPSYLQKGQKFLNLLWKARKHNYPCSSQEARLDDLRLFCKRKEGTRYLLGERMGKDDCPVIVRASNSCIAPVNAGTPFSRLDLHTGQCPFSNLCATCLRESTMSIWLLVDTQNPDVYRSLQIS
jgi:hypothetical protein